MVKYSIEEIVEQAVQTEKLGYAFYKSLAEKFKGDDKLIMLFEFLAGQELEHEKIFNDLKDGISVKGLVDWDEASRYLRAIVESEFFLGNRKALPSLQNIRTGSDALRQAILFEKETLLYFYHMKDIVTEREAVDRIIAEEKSHIQKLAELID